MLDQMLGQPPAVPGTGHLLTTNRILPVPAHQYIHIYIYIYMYIYIRVYMYNIYIYICIYIILHHIGYVYMGFDVGNRGSASHLRHQTGPLLTAARTLPVPAHKIEYMFISHTYVHILDDIISHIYTCIYIYIYIYSCIYLCMYFYRYIYVYAFMIIHIYICMGFDGGNRTHPPGPCP